MAPPRVPPLRSAVHFSGPTLPAARLLPLRRLGAAQLLGSGAAHLAAAAVAGMEDTLAGLADAGTTGARRWHRALLLPHCLCH